MIKFKQFILQEESTKKLYKKWKKMEKKSGRSPHPKKDDKLGLFAGDQVNTSGETLTESPIHAWQNRMKKKGAKQFKQEKSTGPDSSGRHIHALDSNHNCVGKFDVVNGREVREEIAANSMGAGNIATFDPLLGGKKKVLKRKKPQ